MRQVLMLSVDYGYLVMLYTLVYIIVVYPGYGTIHNPEHYYLVQQLRMHDKMGFTVAP